MPTRNHKTGKMTAKKKSRVKKAAKKKGTKKAAKKKVTKKKAVKKRPSTKKKGTKKKTPTRKATKKSTAKKATTARGKGRARRKQKAAAIRVTSSVTADTAELDSDIATLLIEPIAGCTGSNDDTAFDGLFAADFVESSLRDDELAGLMSEEQTHDAATHGDCNPSDSVGALQIDWSADQANGSMQPNGPWYCFPARMWRDLVELMKAR